MPPRYAYWTIILDDAPTSFRTKEREEILPLFNQLKARNPSALLKWFSGGKLWDSPAQAREERERDKVRAFREERARERKEQPWGPGASPRPGSGRAAPESPKAPRARDEDPLAEFRRQHGRPADGSDDPSTRARVQARPEERRGARRDSGERPLRAGPSGWKPPESAPREKRQDRRGKDWRPGGDHRDPRDKYKLPPGEARKRWKERNLGPRGPKPFGGKPFGKKPFGPPSTRDGAERSPRPGKPFGSKPGGARRPFTGRPPGGPKRKG
jgi:23S rRNA pseudouridine2605 synthase